jgi:hypothetical protein
MDITEAKLYMLYQGEQVEEKNFCHPWPPHVTTKAAWILSDNHAAQGRRIVEQK